MPSQHCRPLFEQMLPHVTPTMLFVSATKGLEETTLLRMTEVAAQVIGTGRGFAPRIGALSGPSFAKEVARGDPTAIAVASQDPELAEIVQRAFSDTRTRVHTNDALVGAGLGA